MVQKYIHYREEYYRYQQLHAQNIIEQSKNLGSSSLALLAFTSTFGFDLLRANQIISTIFVVSLVLTIFVVIIGYHFSNQALDFSKNKITDNYNNDRDLSEGLDCNFAAKINDFLNTAVFILFSISIVCFLILILSLLWNNND